MNTIWSEHVQGIKTLYLSRKLRFDDMFFEQYQRTFKIDTNIKMNTGDWVWPRSIGRGTTQVVSQC